MPSIDPVRAGGPSLDELHEANAQPIGGAAPPEEKNAVQAFTRPAGEDQPVGDDSRLESFFRERFGALEPKQRIEIDGKLDVTDGFSGQFRGKLKVERQADGTFTVKTEQSAAVGVGARLLGTSRAAVAAGTTFHLKNAAEAADLCDALVKHTAVKQLPAGQLFSALADGARKLGASGDLIDAGERLRGYEAHAAQVRFNGEFKTDLGDTLKEGFAGFDAEASFKASLKGTGELTVDRERGEVNFTRVIALTSEAKAKLPLRIGGEFEAKVSASVTTTVKMPPEVKVAVERGELSIADAVAQTLKHPAHVSYTAAGEVELRGRLDYMAPSAQGKAVLKTELGLEASQANDPRELVRLLGEAKYSVEVDGALGGKGSVDLGGATAELSVLQHVRHQPYGEALFSLDVALKRGASELAATDGGAFDARRATANLR